MAGEGAGPVVILAGAGLLPVTLARRLQSRDHPYKILAFRGFADKETIRQANEVMDLLDVRGILSCLEKWQPTGIVLAGAVRRPKPSALLGSYSLFRNMNELKDVIARGDDHLLRGAVSLLEEKGFKVIGAHEIAPDIMSGEGVFTRRQPTPSEYEAISHSLELLHTLARFDIGQGLVASGRRILAIEGPEGTDKMLRRVASLQRKSIFVRAVAPVANSVLVKTAKLQQDLRVDMPAIGPRTVREAVKAGIGGIAIGSGKTLILEKEETLREADRHNIFLVGLPIV